MLPNVVNAQDVGMVERSDGAGFLLEAQQTVGISRERGGQDFYGDVPAQALVARAIDLSHAACADE